MGHARQVHATLTEAFADHYRPRSEPFAHWKARRFGHENFDPALWLVAWEGDEVAGALLGYLSPDLGWVQELGVRRSWRGRGIGLALLLESFAAFGRRGQYRVSLGVDAESLTGATRLYERAGMRVERRHELFQKRLH
jgi:ribosomal protein S18 acetylase RimI-like enzyme